MGTWILYSVIAILTMSHATFECPDVCTCEPQGRGQRVQCRGGELVTIISELPHNTARLTVSDLATIHTLNQAMLTRNPPVSIIYLSITNSSLRDVQASAFASLTMLQELDLSQNSIQSIDPDAFAELGGIRYLNLSGNRLSILGNMFQSLLSLQRLDLSHNFITDLPSTVLHSQSSLTYLNLDGNQLHSLHGESLHSQPLLVELRVRDCGLFFINEDIFTAIPKVSIMDLGGNRLKSFPSSVAFHQLKQLKQLYLDDNNLVLHPSQFADLKLHTLSLSRNRMSELTKEALRGLLVEELDLSENKLQELNRTALEHIAGSLTSLNLANNPITVLNSDAFGELRLLETLNLSSCALSQLEHDIFSGLYNLRKLDLSSNHLQNIPEEVFEVFDRLVFVNLYQNAWHCDCQIKPLRNWLRDRRSFHKLYCSPGQFSDECSNLQCSTPDHLNRQQISMLQDVDLAECVEAQAKAATLSPAVQGVIVTACLLLSIGVLIIAIILWRRGRTKKGLTRLICAPSRAESSHEEGEDIKIDPLENCEIQSLKESHRSFVFKHYFDQMVTDPNLLSPVLQDGPEEAQQLKDSVYSSNPSLYSSALSRTVVVGIESAV